MTHDNKTNHGRRTFLLRGAPGSVTLARSAFHRDGNEGAVPWLPFLFVSQQVSGLAVQEFADLL